MQCKYPLFNKGNITDTDRTVARLFCIVIAQQGTNNLKCGSGAPAPRGTKSKTADTDGLRSASILLTSTHMKLSFSFLRLFFS